LSLLRLAAVDGVILWRIQVGAGLRLRGCPSGRWPPPGMPLSWMPHRP